MAKRKPKSPIEGRWNIVSMTEWDEEFLHEEVQAFIEFSLKDNGEFQFGYVRSNGLPGHRERRQSRHRVHLGRIR